MGSKMIHKIKHPYRVPGRWEGKKEKVLVHLCRKEQLQTVILFLLKIADL